MKPSQMSGLQLMQGMCNGTIPMPSMSETIPMLAGDVELGKVIFTVKADHAT